jgi:molybdate transport system substrate-binding protein
MKHSHPRPLRAAGVVTALLLVAPALAACGGGDDDQQELTVFAASSLTEAFTTLADDFEKDHSNVDVKLSFGSSTDLATQVNEGSPADVLATADEKSMDVAANEGNIDGDPTQFATNTLILVTPPDNPAGITSLDDLDGADFVVCDPSVPCGAAAATILDNAGVTAEPKSLEEDVKAVLTKVTTGEADAGIVYVTDAAAAGSDVSTVDIPTDVNVVNPYLIGVVKDSDDSDTAQEWVDLVNSQAGQGVLSDDGFGPASP